MSRTNAPNPLQQQPLPLEPEPTASWYTPLLPFVKWIGILVLFYLFGPVIQYAKTTQEQAAGPLWQAEQRWARINGTTFFSLLWYVPIAIFHAPLAAFWSALFLTLAQWIHLPILAWVGGTSLLPPGPSSMLLRWLLSFPLAGLLTVLMEMVRPQTTWESQRVLTQEEHVQIATAAAAQERKKIQATQRPPTPTPAPKKQKVSTPKQPNTNTIANSINHQPRTPGSDSLWGEIDWEKIPDTHPLKQAALQEARDLEATRREDARKQWLVQQQASFTSTGSPSSIVDSTLAPPEKPPAQPAAAPKAEQDYNWDEGNGSIQA